MKIHSTNQSTLPQNLKEARTYQDYKFYLQNLKTKKPHNVFPYMGYYVSFLKNLSLKTIFINFETVGKKQRKVPEHLILNGSIPWSCLQSFEERNKLSIQFQQFLQRHLLLASLQNAITMMRKVISLRRKYLCIQIQGYLSNILLYEIRKAIRKSEAETAD